MAIKRKFKRKKTVSAVTRAEIAEIESAARKAIARVTKADLDSQPDEEDDPIQPRIQWVRCVDDTGRGFLEQVKPSIAKQALYGYATLLLPTTHPKLKDIVRKLDLQYVPQTRYVKGAPR